jgi:hypothetical protein
LLECLESPETAIPGCLSFLKKLHALPAVQEIFNVYLNKGVKSMLNKGQRVENVKSVMMINYVVFKYVLKFSSKYSSAYAWPTIKLADRSFNPILNWQEVSTRKSMGDELTQPPNRLICNTTILSHISAVNSHGHVFVRNGMHQGYDSIKIINKKCKSKVVNLPSHGDNVLTQSIVRGIVALAVDNDDNVYVHVRLLEIPTENGDVISYMLDVLDENYNVKQDSRRLEFVKATPFYVDMAINKNNDIIMATYSARVYIFDNTGKLKYTFERSSHYQPILGISGQDEIMISSGDNRNRPVEIYSEGNLKSTIKLPEGHEYHGLAFHYVICKIILLSRVEREFVLLCYTEAGELETTTFIGDYYYYEFQSPTIKSHPSGRVAVIDEESITFI